MHVMLQGRSGRWKRSGAGELRIAVYRYDRIRYGPNFDQTRSSLVPARFYCPDPPSDGIYRLKAGEAKHLSRVCRLGVGDEVEIFDGRGIATRTESSPSVTIGWI